MVREYTPYDIENPKDIQRLLLDLKSYMEISVKDGTDFKGRELCLDALRRYKEKVKKEEPKFPKVFENESLRITVNEGQLIDIEDKVNKDLGEVGLVRLAERKYGDIKLIKEAIKYAEENQ